MIRLHHAALSRSVRIVWLLEELGLPYELRTVTLEPGPRPFAQKTPFGKVPVLEDGDTVLFESGAIVEHLLERHGGGRLAPPPGSPLRAAYLQWLHFAESTAFAGLGNIAWHTRFRNDAASLPQAMADYREWAVAAVDVVEAALEGRDFLLGAELSGADVALGYTLLVARAFDAVGEQHARVQAYLRRLLARPAFQKALAAGQEPA
jgi:glutathione S-transferase